MVEFLGQCCNPRSSSFPDIGLPWPVTTVSGFNARLPLEDVTAVTDISIRAASYAIPGVTVDGNDVFAVYEAAMEAVERARNGQEPTLA
ncbi:hypothetical protein G9U52_08985 [Paenibacillus sp. S3N08]|uniref:Dehydrogenase E1 component domain-containing protein n=1 Tax=Paenibacillus agricola TaxID=2716264 RepID=A0ABX0J556_9BACL|nr:hypothetical protein [Paenibacillus agricola]